MRTFKDSTGREWKLAITTQSVYEVKEVTGVLLTKLFDHNWELFGQLCDDVLQLVPILWTIVAEQAEAAGVNPKEFTLAGDSITDAAVALGRATIDFFPSQERRTALQAAMDTTEKTNRAITTKLASSAMATIQKADPESLADAYINSVLNAPESPA